MVSGGGHLWTPPKVCSMAKCASSANKKTKNQNANCKIISKFTVQFFISSDQTNAWRWYYSACKNVPCSTITNHYVHIALRRVIPTCLKAGYWPVANSFALGSTGDHLEAVGCGCMQKNWERNKLYFIHGIMILVESRNLLFSLEQDR